MKKFATLLCFVLSGFGFASAQCTVDSSNTAFFKPRPDSLPCVERNIAYNQVIQIHAPASLDLKTLYPQLPISFILYIDSVVIDSVTGIPVGITEVMHPVRTIYGNTYACALVSGTTSAPAGIYPLYFHGRMTLHGMPFPPYFSGDTTIDMATLQGYPRNPFHAALVVINQGDHCYYLAGINDASSTLNAMLNVFPNPNNGKFELQLNAGGRINGEIVVMDMTGKMVYNEKLDVMGLYNTSIDLSRFAKGLYTLQLRTSEGFASKNISVQ